MERESRTPANGDLFVLAVGGSEVKQLTDPPEGIFDHSPSWSPDGKRIAFIRWDDMAGPDVWVVNADGADAAQLTQVTYNGGRSTPSWEASPVWTPNSSMIGFTSAKDNVVPQAIFIMNADGLDVGELGAVDSQQFLGTIAWSDDGWWILHTRILRLCDDCGSDIYLLRLDGLTVRVTSDGRSHSPAFLRR